jgi:hypothetical protein
MDRNGFPISLLWWVINITDLFNLIYLVSKDNLPSKVYINVVDHPIVRNDGKHPFVQFREGVLDDKGFKIDGLTPDPKYPIYCWPSKKNYNDIGLPFHDIWMFLFCREFNKDFNILNWQQKMVPFEKKTISKAIFRGSYTNCQDTISDKSTQNTPRFRAHILSLQNPDYIDAYVVGSQNTWKYSDYKNSFIDTTDIPNFLSPKLFLKETEQFNYKYILNLDGFGSAFRIIKELFYDGIIIIPDSEYTDVIRDMLVPWKHYIPCNNDLSNLVNTVKWCNNNENLLKIIINNVRELRKIITIDNMLNFTAYKINNNPLNYARYCNFDVNSQSSIYPIPLINNDPINLLNKDGKILWKTSNGIIEREENVHYGGSKY